MKYIFEIDYIFSFNLYIHKIYLKMYVRGKKIHLQYFSSLLFMIYFYSNVFSLIEIYGGQNIFINASNMYIYIYIGKSVQNIANIFLEFFIVYFEIHFI